ncbi:inositol monophosphatase family protein [Haloprofundus halophilus]|uniref:inositol monophosphatase family protein n=1 Tax=Haloprofundus halophilus TaxID=2283527 RepID=UPI000E42DB88|nr:inositol monophosphatase [Haloprofundus halophilus]
MADVSLRAAVARRAAEAGAAVAFDRFRRGIDVETKEGKTDVVTQADRDAQARVADVIADAFPEDELVGEESVAPRATEEASGRGPRADDALKTVPDDGDAWVVDPIDGTNNYVRNIRIWATAVAAVREGEPVAAASALPALGDTYVADADAVYRNGHEVSVSGETDPEKSTVVPTVWWDFDHRDEYAAATREIVERFGDMRRFGCAQAVLAMVADGSLEGTMTNIVTNPWDTVAGVYMVRRAGGTVTDLEGDRWRHDSKGLVASNGAVHDEVLAAARGIEKLDD